MVIFGGFICGGTRCNTIYRYYFKDNKWEHVKIMGEIMPSPRAGHSSVIHNDSMYVFGGKDEDNNKLNELWRFDFTNYTWQEVKTYEDPPLPRSGHSACLF